MTDISRRWFLGGVLGVAAAVTLPSIKILPRIVADGIHDDYEGLQAFFDGRAVDLVNDGISLIGGDHKQLVGGKFKLSRGLVFPAKSKITIEKCWFRLNDLRSNEAILTFNDTEQYNLIKNVTFNVPESHRGRPLI